MENNTFGEDEAKSNLKDYRKRGSAKQTKLILEVVRSLGLKGASLLDVGGGIGTIHHELLKDVASQATHPVPQAQDSNQLHQVDLEVRFS
jgi:magnesium-protoporphyrin O-methyltransferase